MQFVYFVGALAAFAWAEYKFDELDNEPELAYALVAGVWGAVLLVVSGLLVFLAFGGKL